jgi:hypothetical protein
MPDNTDQLLTEIRGLRGDLAAHSERMVAVETILHTLTGNGQPGRLAILENKVTQLQEFRFWLIGAAAGFGVASSLVMHFLLR